MTTPPAGYRLVDVQHRQDEQPDEDAHLRDGEERPCEPQAAEAREAAENANRLFPLSLAAMIVGWVFTEMGRQPWIVFSLLPTESAVSPNVTGLDVLGSVLPLGRLPDLPPRREGVGNRRGGRGRPVESHGGPREPWRRGGLHHAVAFDAAQLSIRGQPFSVQDGVFRGRAGGAARRIIGHAARRYPRR